MPILILTTEMTEVILGDWDGLKLRFEFQLAAGRGGPGLRASFVGVAIGMRERLCGVCPVPAVHVTTY
jgi:hypothetical protein